MTSRAGTNAAQPYIPLSPQVFDPQAKRPVERFVFVNRGTICPVCLKALDIANDDVVPYIPTYLSPFDSLRAYDGCYHRACLYRTGDYPRMIEAWHRGVQAQLREAEAHDWPRVVALERDFAAVRWQTDGPLELMLFPRFARWLLWRQVDVSRQLQLLQRFLDSADRRNAHVTDGNWTIRSVANHPMCTFQALQSLEVTAVYPREALLPRWTRPRQIGPWRQMGSMIQLSAGPAPQHLEYSSEPLEPELDWDLRDISGRSYRWREAGEVRRVTLLCQRKRFIPIWDDEAEGLVTFLRTHQRAMRSAME